MNSNEVWVVVNNHYIALSATSPWNLKGGGFLAYDLDKAESLGKVARKKFFAEKHLYNEDLEKAFKDIIEDHYGEIRSELEKTGKVVLDHYFKLSSLLLSFMFSPNRAVLGRENIKDPEDLLPLVTAGKEAICQVMHDRFYVDKGIRFIHVKSNRPLFFPDNVTYAVHSPDGGLSVGMSMTANDMIVMLERESLRFATDRYVEWLESYAQAFSLGSGKVTRLLIPPSLTEEDACKRIKFLKLRRMGLFGY